MLLWIRTWVCLNWHRAVYYRFACQPVRSSSALYRTHGLCQDVDLNREQLEGVPFVLSRVLASLHNEQGCGHFLAICGAITSIALGILTFGESTNGEPWNCNPPVRKTHRSAGGVLALRAAVAFVDSPVLYDQPLSPIGEINGEVESSVAADELVTISETGQCAGITSAATNHAELRASPRLGSVRFCSPVLV